MTDAETTATPPAIELAPLSAAAKRMRLHRERRRLGLRCLTIELRETEVNELIKRGFLRSEGTGSRLSSAQVRPELAGPGVEQASCLVLVAKNRIAFLRRPRSSLFQFCTYGGSHLAFFYFSTFAEK
jgi:hypothetical protein